MKKLLTILFMITALASQGQYHRHTYRVVPVNTAPISYTTLNPSDKDAAVTLSGGNLTAAFSSSPAGVRSVVACPNVKVYWEATVNAIGATNSTTIGVANNSFALNVNGGSDVNSWVLLFDNSSSYSVYNNSYVGYGGVAAGSVLGFELDVPNGTLQIFLNNTSLFTFSSGGGNAVSGTVYAYVGSRSDNTGNITMNFGASAFTYTGHSGFQQGF